MSCCAAGASIVINIILGFFSFFSDSSNRLALGNSGEKALGVLGIGSLSQGCP